MRSFIFFFLSWKFDVSSHYTFNTIIIAAAVIVMTVIVYWLNLKQ